MAVRDGLLVSCCMSFADEIYVIHVNYYHSYREMLAVPALDEIARKLFGPDYPSASKLEQLTQLALVSSHPAITHVEPLPPNVISVGGLQIKDPRPLEEVCSFYSLWETLLSIRSFSLDAQDIERFLSQGQKGSVLFSLGTNVKSKNLGSHILSAILDAFKQLPQYNFLWKLETDGSLANVPSNVLIRDWVSQNDVLAHRNVKAFVTHAGSLSSYEAAWHAVPTVGIPFLIDQFTVGSSTFDSV